MIKSWAKYNEQISIPVERVVFFCFFFVFNKGVS